MIPVLENIQKINEVAGAYKQPWTKKRMDNLVLPPFTDFAIFGEIMRQVVRTKEEPEGHLYEESEYRMVLRVLDGRLLMHGMYDAYAWDNAKVMKELKKYSDGNVPRIGTHDPTGHALLNFANVLATITDSREKQKFAAMISQSAFDLLLITTMDENRMVIEITPDLLESLHQAGVTSVVNDWEYKSEGYPAADVMAQETTLKAGDFLICTTKGFYINQHDEFLAAHKPGHHAMAQ